MDVNKQVSALQDDVKLLKNEIKTVLKELRTAVLSRDNPFSAGVNQPQPQAEPSDSGASGDKAKEPEGQLAIPQTPAAAPPPPPVVVAPTVAPAAPPPVAPAPPPAGATPAAPPTDGPPARASERTGRPKLKVIRSDEDEPSEPHWNLLTVASLAAWAEEAVETLGPKSFQIVLELACFADLLTPKLRDVLDNIGRLSLDQLDQDEDGLPMSINECLVLLRQLEAIVQGGAVVQAPSLRARAA